MVNLRPYQQNAIRETHAALRRVNRVVLVQPTGSGKSHMTRWWASGIANQGRRCAFITHRRVLVRQLQQHCVDAGIEYGTIMANEPVNEDAFVQVCSIDTLQKRGWFDNPLADWLIIDEIHVNESRYRELISQYPRAKVVGLTATPANEQGRRLTIADEIVEPVKNSPELIRDGWLLPTQVYAPCEIDTSDMAAGANGEWSQDELGRRIERGFSTINLWKHWEPFSDRQTIVWVPRVMFAEGLAEQFRERGYSAEVLVATVDKNEREDMFRRFTDGDLRVIVGVQIPSIGLDLPIASCGVDLQPSRQLRNYWQKKGRIQRIHEGQEHAVWLDLVGNVQRHLHPDEDPEWPTDDVTTTAELVKKRKEKESEGDVQPWECPGCSYAVAKWERLPRDKDGSKYCPNCGMEFKKAKRRIVMGDGSLKVLSVRKRKKKQQSDVNKAWSTALCVAIQADKQLNLARHIFHSNTGKWPSDVGIDVPSWNSSDWKMKAAVFAPQLDKYLRSKRRGSQKAGGFN